MFMTVDLRQHPSVFIFLGLQDPVHHHHEETRLRDYLVKDSGKNKLFPAAEEAPHPGPWSA